MNHKHNLSQEYIESNSIPAPEAGCWLWDKCVAPNGYGQLNRKNKVMYAHRLSYELFKGRYLNEQ